MYNGKARQQTNRLHSIIEAYMAQMILTKQKITTTSYNRQTILDAFRIENHNMQSEERPAK